ncbi:EF-hand domain-containing family member B-like isoform X1 [Amphibalanus amphitrite]|uniref:EF-hand domain-containing family member B-like isoform X1 n=1 Tax=Amphibalanus amphitrite TaxID=1232801 RepID=UPI001C9251ED|nr:EF-hand domain-containing family member B-like isoform X1 [Amphibalanus amphitrite]
MTSDTSHYNQADTNLYHAIHSDLVGELLHPPRGPPTPDSVRKFRRAHYADPGAKTYHWGVADDPNDKPNQVHGTKFGTKSLAGDVVNPPVVARPHRLLAAARRLTYDSTLRRPVGCAPLRQPAVPPHLACAGAATFGLPTKYGDTVAQCVSPYRTAQEFQANWCKGTDLYRRSHRHTNPGEQTHRSYGQGFNTKAKFGVPTYNEENHTGRRVKECVTWPGPSKPLSAVCSWRAESWRELHQDRVGQPLDRYQCTRDLPATFTYGAPMRHVLSGALDIATARTSCSLPAEDLARLDLILVTRRKLQAAGFTGFIALLQTMKKMDKLGTKRLPLEAVLAACCQQCLPLATAELRALVERLNLAEGPRRLVIYSLLVATLNWKDRLTLGHLDREWPVRGRGGRGAQAGTGSVNGPVHPLCDRPAAPPPAVLRKEPRPVAECRTSTSCQLPPPPPDWTVERRRSSGPGEPPENAAGPRRDRVVDVVTPSPFIEAGLRETELTMPRSEAFLMELLCGMGVCDYRQFQALYAAARRAHPPDPSVLDVLDEANRSCCPAPAGPAQQRPAKPAQQRPAKPAQQRPAEPAPDGRLCAAGLEEVRAVAESRPCRGTDQLATVPPSLDGERKLRFAESALETDGKRLPRTDPGCGADFLRPTPPDDRLPCPTPPAANGGDQQCDLQTQPAQSQPCAHRPPSQQPQSQPCGQHTAPIQQQPQSQPCGHHAAPIQQQPQSQPCGQHTAPSQQQPQSQPCGHRLASRQ